MTEEAAVAAAGGVIPAGPPKMHGLSSTEGGRAVQFGMAAWPYDLLLRFGYDLPENEYMWPDEWFDDTFEAAALDLRLTAAKLMFAIRDMHAAVAQLDNGSVPPAKDVAALKAAIEHAPLALDLVLGYLRRVQDNVAKVVPCCYGVEGKALAGARGSIATLANAPRLAVLDAGLVPLLRAAPTLDVRTCRPDLYVIGQNDGFRAALPKAAARALRTSGEVTIAAAKEVDGCIATTFAWLDAVLVQLQSVVVARAEDGPGLLERWTEPDWSVLMMLTAGDVLEAHLPVV
jgi:hypothetical protein